MREKFKVYLKKTVRFVGYPIALLIDWVLAEHLVDDLVLYPDGKCLQVSSIHHEKSDDEEESNMDEALLHCDWNYEGDLPSCPICLLTMDKLGLQEIKCEHIDAYVTLGLTDSQIKNMHTKLIDDNDAVGLKTVKDRCAKALPTAGFKREVKMYLIEAGPGCGKSYMIRQLADEHDLILAPFTKLRPDYINLTNDPGGKYDLTFKTTHRAMETRSARRIFVDEFTSMPYEFLACIAEVNGAEKIFLVGDPKKKRYHIINRLGYYK